MAVRSGRMRHRFELLQFKLDVDGKPIRDEYGNPVEEFDVLMFPWANVKDVKSAEFTGYSADSGQEQLQFEVRYSNQYLAKTDMFIRFEGVIYDIISVVDPHKRRERLLITAKQRR